jgi:RimJ/RimL family protein N-acetyltransferase
MAAALAIEVQSIETPRLTLRAHRRDDFAACAAMWGDPAVTRHIGGKPFTPEEVWARLLRYVGHWAWQGFGYWAVEERASGAFVGDLGFADWRRAIEPSIEGVPELGWVLAAHAHGRGLATEAARAAIDWGEQRFGADARTVCIIDPENRPSLRVAEKCGYRELARTTYHGGPTILLERAGRPR